jgi:hypothetical protein
MRASSLTGFLLSLIILAGCGSGGSISKVDDPSAAPSLLPVPVPTVSDPPDVGTFFLQANSFPLSDVGYEAQEVFFEGTASAFTNLNELQNDGQWQVEPGEQADYRTRLVVHRPVNAADFNGSVLVEWLNVTSGFDIPPSWGSGHVEMYRSGHVWIGVSAQLVGIEGSETSLAPLHLKNVNPERYGSLRHPGDSFAYDIFSQVTSILRGRANVDILNGMVPERILAYGESQSAFYLVTYVNAIQPLYGAYDGFMVHSRGGGAGPLAQAPQVPIPAPDATRIRVDSGVPVLTFQTETDLTLLGYAAARQDDSELFRLWEVAGTAHADYYTIVSGRNDAIGEPQFAAVVEEDTVLGFLRCDRPFNSGPMHYVFNRAVRALDEWVREGIPPATAPRLALTDDQSGFIRDESGNVAGGIRTPYVDAPVAVLSGEGQSGESFCFLFGTTELYSADEMVSRYVDEGGYVGAVIEAANAAVAEGFLLPEDAEAIIEWAPQQWRQQTGLP